MFVLLHLRAIPPGFRIGTGGPQRIGTAGVPGLRGGSDLTFTILKNSENNVVTMQPKKTYSPFVGLLDGGFT